MKTILTLLLIFLLILVLMLVSFILDNFWTIFLIIVGFFVLVELCSDDY